MKITWQSILQNQKTTIDETAIRNDCNRLFLALFNRLSDDEEIAPFLNELPELANDILDEFPGFFESINIKIQAYEDFCHTCIITDEEVTEIARKIHSIWLEKKYNQGYVSYEQLDDANTVNPDLVQFDIINENRKRFYREMVYCVPVLLKELAFELIKPNETEFFKPKLAEQIARALHERYRYLMNSDAMQKETMKAYESTYLFDAQYVGLEFDQLNESIKHSNIDSAYHIATKLLSIGYSITKAEQHIEPNLLILDASEIETMSKLEHERWCWEKRLSGFIYGKAKTDKTHYCLVPYDQLSEFEKSKDRDQVEQYPMVIKDLRYEVKSIHADKLQNISYQLRRQSNIEKSMLAIEKQYDIIAKAIESNPSDIMSYKETLESTKNGLGDALQVLKDVRDGIRRSEQTQQSIFASKLFFKTCLPDSFLLFKPLDVVSGDFYFVSKIHGQIIFAAADCTGHGIPGAMLSMICYNFIDIAVNDHNLTDPVAILKFVFNKLEALIYRQVGRSASGDGMDIAICAFQPDTLLLSYAGVNRPLYLIQNGNIREIKAIRYLGNKSDIVNNNSLNSQRMLLNKGDQFYIFSDGYADQFGGETIPTKKIGTKTFASIIAQNSTLSMSLQREALNTFIEKWKLQGNEAQTDDVMVIGVKV